MEVDFSWLCHIPAGGFVKCVTSECVVAVEWQDRHDDATSGLCVCCQPGRLVLETLLSLTSKQASDWFKDSLRTLGVLDHFVNTGTVPCVCLPVRLSLCLSVCLSACYLVLSCSPISGSSAPVKNVSVF